MTALILIVLTYFYYPNLDKGGDLKDEIVQEKLKDNLSDKESTTFDQVKYKGIYDFDKSFIIEAEKAYILNDDPDVVYITSMLEVLHLKNVVLVKEMLIDFKKGFNVITGETGAGKSFIIKSLDSIDVDQIGANSINAHYLAPNIIFFISATAFAMPKLRDLATIAWPILSSKISCIAAICAVFS